MICDNSMYWVLSWFKHYLKVTNGEAGRCHFAFSAAIARKSLRTLESLVTLFYPSLEDVGTHIFNCAIQAGDVEILSYLHSQFTFTYSHVCESNYQILRTAGKEGNIEIWEFLLENFPITRQDVCADNLGPFVSAAANGHLPLLKWLKTRFEITTAEIDESEALEQAEDREVIDWLF